MPKAERPDEAPNTRWWILAFVSLVMLGNYYVYDAIGPVACWYSGGTSIGAAGPRHAVAPEPLCHLAGTFPGWS